MNLCADYLQRHFLIDSISNLNGIKTSDMTVSRRIGIPIKTLFSSFDYAIVIYCSENVHIKSFEG